MKTITKKDSDLLFHFDKIDETQAQTGNTSPKHLLFNNHDVAANKGKIKRHLPLEHIFGFCGTFEKITKQIDFHLTFKLWIHKIFFIQHKVMIVRLILINFFI